ncbi:uncharacterized protein G2W53_008193 [Senna tora]|uniref:Uncharacterized protein n=1 Tax=Senna tora TaxID=362788 RepID=A0A835CEF5_9FABA|nr:uncharacterized protein G2W53_008193 [Senna tora]
MASFLLISSAGEGTSHSSAIS